MPREIALAGANVPGLLLIYLSCLLVHWLIDTLIGHYDGYRHVWHPALFRVAFFLCMFGAVSLLLYP